MSKSFIVKNSTVVFLHLFGWLCFLIYPFIIGAPFREDLLYKFFFHSSLLACFFYINIFILIPRFLTKGKLSFYFISVMVIIGLIVTVNLFFNQLFDVDLKQFSDNPPPRRHFQPEHFRIARDIRKITRPFFSALFIFAVSTSYKLLLDWFKNEKKKKEIENEALVSELSFLKSQVSPHFLFNTLNNIYSLSLSNSEKTSDAIIKLSQLLRYMLYESNVKEVSLVKEIEYLETYIDLQKIRLRNDVQLSFETEGDFSGEIIEPMLLIPFIENAFKHGINYSQQSYILISITVSDHHLYLKSQNSRHIGNKEKDKASGIGLQNVQRRLNLLYPEKHTLTISESETDYRIELNIQLQ